MTEAGHADRELGLVDEDGDGVDDRREAPAGQYAEERASRLRAPGSGPDDGSVRTAGRSHEPDGTTRERELRARPPEQQEGVLDAGGVRPKPRRDA